MFNRTLFGCAALITLASSATNYPAFAQEDAALKGAAAYQEGNFAEAEKWLRIAAEQGQAEPQFLLGTILDEGLGILQNDAEAVEWYRLAAEQGLVQAQFMLGKKYLLGDGIAENDLEAAIWFRRSAERGFADAQALLGFRYLFGEGVPQDFVQAYVWFNLAAAQGDESARQARELVREQMTPSQIADGQRLSSEWRPRGRE